MPLRNNINLSAGMPGVWNRAPRAAQKYWSLQRVDIPGLSPVCLIKGRNSYTTYCYKNKKKPLLPSAKIAKSLTV